MSEEKYHIVTGDNNNTAQAMAGKLGLDDYRGEVLPEDKAGYVSKEKERGSVVAMIGDGINDAPALALADVGIAVGSGALIAREVSDITISSDSLLELIWLKDLSDALMVRIQRNYRFVIGFNGALILLGVLGLVPPAASALLHNSSTLLLSLNCMTALKERNVQNGKS